MLRVTLLLLFSKQRVDDSEQCLAMFKRNKPEFLRRYVTMDETWIHHFTPESKRSSSEWTATGEPRPKRPKAQQSAKDKSFYKSGIEMLERRWNDCVALDGDYVDE